MRPKQFVWITLCLLFTVVNPPGALFCNAIKLHTEIGPDEGAVISTPFFAVNVFSSFTGTATGGITNFVMGRHWVFRATNSNRTEQIIKYILVWTGNMALNSMGVCFFTGILNFHYMLSKVLVSVIVGVLFNYYLQNNFVFNAHI